MAISVTDFTLAAPSGLTVKTATLAALDTSGAVTAGVITESATPPVAGDASWVAWNGADGTRPAGLLSQTLTAGAHTLYGHVKDGAGNRGSSAGQGVTVSAGSTVPAVVGIGTFALSPGLPTVSGGILSTDLLVAVIAENPAAFGAYTKKLGAAGFSVWYRWGSGGGATSTRGQVACIRGSAGSGDPFDVVSAVASSADDTPPTAASIATLGANRLALFVAAMAAADDTDQFARAQLGTPTTGTARTQVFNGAITAGGNTTAYAVGMWSGDMATQGSTGTETAVRGTVSWADSLTTACALLAVKPA